MYESLKYHLSDMICRMKIGMTIRNPLLREIKDKYPSVFGASWAFSILFEKYFGLMVSVASCIYQHIFRQPGAAGYYTVTACVVCNAMASFAHSLSRELKYRFPNIHVTDVLSYEKFRQICQDGGGSWEMVISNRPAGGRQPVVCVSPILTRKMKVHRKAGKNSFQETASEKGGGGRQEEAVMCAGTGGIWLQRC